MSTITHRLKTTVFGLALLSVLAVAGSFVWASGGENMEELAELQSQIASLQILLDRSAELTPAQRAELNQSITAIEDEIVLLMALDTTGVTMEMVAGAGPSAEVQVITSDGVETLSFTFGSSFAGASTAALLEESVLRAADALTLNPATLRNGATAVSSFSGITVPLMPVSAPDARTNIESIFIGGSVPDYDIQATVVYGPEGAYSRATVTREFTFTRPEEAETLNQALEDLVAQGQAAVVEEFGINPGKVYADAVISIERYEDEDDVPTTRSFGFPTTDPASYSLLENSLVMYFGSYSVVESITISTNQVEGARRGEAFSISLLSDQNEELVFSLAPEYRRSGRDDDWSPTGDLEAALTYSIHDVVVETSTDGNADYDGFMRYLETYFASIGQEFMTTDDVFIPLLGSYLARNASVYETGSFSPFATVGETVAEQAQSCLTPSDVDVVKKAAAFMLGGLQYYQDINEVITVTPNIENYRDDDRGFTFSRCRNIQTDHFESIATTTTP